jgi:hypothetical protein
VRLWLMMSVIALSAACAENHQYFRPTERVSGHTAGGEAEALYALNGPFGPFGEAKVWSAGAFRDQGRTVLHVAIELHNTSGVLIEVDPAQVRLDPVRVGQRLIHGLRPAETQRLSVAPGAFGEVRLHFVMPDSVRPAQVSSFGVRWQVQNGPQSYSQITPFLEQYRGYAYHPASLYGFGYGYFCSPYDPFCRPGGYGYYAPYGPPVYVAPPMSDRRPHEVIRTR